jgi:SAM-dependent methyltransferase
MWHAKFVTKVVIFECSGQSRAIQPYIRYEVAVAPFRSYSPRQREMNPLVHRLQSRLYPTTRERDAVLQFLEVLQNFLRPDAVVLDIGAGGGGLNRYSFRGRVRRVIGIDLDPRVSSNPLVDEGIVYDGHKMPIADSTVDLAFSIYVHEHVETPDEFAAEVMRILRPGGVYLALTPSRMHYVSVIASVTPTSFHRWLNKKRGRNEQDTFATYYRINTVAASKKHFGSAGFSTTSISAIEVEPQYLKFNPILYLFGVAYERLVNSSKLFECFRVNLIVQCIK